MNELKSEVLDRFWSIYDTEGTVQALNWLDSLKYYEEYCQDDMTFITAKLQNLMK
jgi:hypothetical protein